jgi:hypothetical protein
MSGGRPRQWAGILRRHFQALDRMPRWTFLWRVWIEAVVLAYAAANLAQHVFPAGPRMDLVTQTSWRLCILVLLVGPLTETMLFQCLPTELAVAAKARRLLRIAVSVVPFALMHRFAGVPTVVAAGFVGGFYFAFTYDRWRRESLFVGVMMTFLLHSSFNLVGAIALLLGR